MNQYFGKNLRHLRKLHGLSQKKLAEELGISRSKVASYETLMVEPKLILLSTISNYFNISISSLIGIDLGRHISIHVDTAEDEEINTSVRETVESFIKETKSVADIIEGYKIFYEMQKQNEVYSRDPDPALESLLDKLIELIFALTECNYDFVKIINKENSRT